MKTNNSTIVLESIEELLKCTPDQRIEGEDYYLINRDDLVTLLENKRRAL